MAIGLIIQKHHITVTQMKFQSYAKLMGDLPLQPEITEKRKMADALGAHQQYILLKFLFKKLPKYMAINLIIQKLQ